ncbi:hypothetical protein [Bacillus sp. S/N-304-OC-R1]|uniref:hypothetical protein n=1 Tax=Bacillus sp. S/N-304-OC-R1 TaxID=2758034 RepID=UPI001C8EC2A0|nr:hypothetical protein [Bacillus sp. S/N-304-OC-R1]MBY0121037.1 hypothetical protein [Bacillus sp. S/N-304-OC-R1]
MDRAVIFGAFQFIGYQFCRSLLEQGLEVIGIHSSDDDIDAYLSEKRLEIGRNANFNERSPTQWMDEEEFNGRTIILFDYYETDINNLQASITKNCLIEEFLNKNREKIDNMDTKIVSLFPIQFFVQLNDRIEQANSNYSHRFFLPTIYGPWQPNTFLFQQSLLKTIFPDQHIVTNECEWIHDTLYIEDIVDPIIELTENNCPQTWILKSETVNHWGKCADYLSIPIEVIEKVQHKEIVNGRMVNNTIVKSCTHFTEGLEKQKRQIRLLHDGCI